MCGFGAAGVATACTAAIATDPLITDGVRGCAAGLALPALAEAPWACDREGFARGGSADLLLILVTATEINSEADQAAFADALKGVL